MTRRTRRTERIVFAVVTAIAVGCLTLLASEGSANPSGPFASERASALAPDAAPCAGNSAFCGAVLRVDSSTGTIGSVAAGAHYGSAWGIPATPNDSTGTGWCVDDTHTGFPAGPISERPLPMEWTSNDQRVAATIIALYGGDRVLPYQPLEIDAVGELVADEVTGTNSTLLRHVAVWLALRSVLADPAGTPRIDLASATSTSDRAGRSPSPTGNAAIPLALEMVGAARRVTARDGDPVVTIEMTPDDSSNEPDTPISVAVRVTDPTGRPIPHVPVWPDAVANAAITSHASDDRDSRQANSNAVLAGWPSFDTTGTRSGAAVTNMDGVAFFSLRVLTAGEWSASFTTETAPTRLALFGDDIRAQNNVALRGATATLATASVDGDATQRHIRVVKTSTDAARSIAGATFALFDADGTEVDRATTGHDGTVEFVVGARHRAPLRVREVAAPPGLRAVVGDIDVTMGDNPVSTDPNRPTIVTVENEPLLHEVSIVKRVLGTPSEPADLSGFIFTIVRQSHPDDPDGPTDPARVATGANGRTPAVQLAAGDYDILEVGRPEWWPTDDPLPPARILSIIVGDDREITVAIDNTFPAPPATTSTTISTSSTSTSTTTTSPTTSRPPPDSAVPPSTGPPESTTTTAAAPPAAVPPTTVPPTTVPPSPGPPTTGPPLPRTGGESWRVSYRIGSLVVLAGAILFFASTIGLGSGRTRGRAQHAVPHAMRADRDEQ